jgi:SAM-dependent methyltransferase
MNTYQALHARHYDLIYADKPYAGEAAFVTARLPAPGRLLDLACGTGRHARAFAEQGWEVTGIDYSADLLELARAAAPDIRFVEADMRTLDLGERFDAVTCLFDSIGYPQTDEGVVAALAAAGRHLEPGGVLAVEHLHTPAMLRSYDPVKVRRWALEDGGTLLRVSATELDAARSVMEVDYELLELRADGTYERATEHQANRFFTVPEFRALLREAGLRPRAAEAAYDGATDVTADTWHVLELAGHA